MQARSGIVYVLKRNRRGQRRKRRHLWGMRHTENVADKGSHKSKKGKFLLHELGVFRSGSRSFQDSQALVVGLRVRGLFFATVNVCSSLFPLL